MKQLEHDNDLLLFMYWMIENKQYVKTDDDYTSLYTLFQRDKKIKKINENNSE